MKLAASLAAFLVLAAVGSASAQQARIAWSDLDLASGRGAEAFDLRVDRASDRLCRSVRQTGSLIPDREHCRAAARAEALRQLPEAARVDYARGRGVLSL